MVMKSTSSNPSPGGPAAQADPAAWTWGTDLAQQLAAGTEGAALLFRGLEAMRQIQDQAAQQVVQRHAAAARDLGSSPRAADAFALQSELVRGDLEDAARCWLLLMGEALEVGNELIACSARLVNTEDVFAAAHLFHRPKG